MWEICTATNLAAGTSPLEWLDGVLPQSEDTCEPQYQKARERLEQGTFAATGTFFAADAQGPTGIAVAAVAEDGLRLELVAVRRDSRRRGLGRRLLEKVAAAGRRESCGRVVVTDVQLHNEAAGPLLKAAGFSGRSQGGLHMRRPLDGTWPPGPVPQGFVLRTLREGEQQAWVDLKNACFPGTASAWTIEHFRREYVDNPIFDLGRIFVVERDGRLVGTTSAWEHNYGWGLVGVIHWVGVEPGSRGRGLGQALNGRSLDELQARGYAEAWLSTSRDLAAAVRLYKRLGFVVARESFTYCLDL